MFRCHKLFQIYKCLPIARYQRHVITVPMRFVSIVGSNGRNDIKISHILRNNNKQIEWKLLVDYAYKSHLLKFSDSEIIDWIKLSDSKADVDSIEIRDVQSCGQRYITYLTYDEHDDLHQYVIVRGTKNWKNIKTSLQYTVAYNQEFEMYLHNGYGTASHAVLQDLKHFIHPHAKLNLTGHSYGGVVCCCIARKLQKDAFSEINQIITFGMPQFSTTRQMNEICGELPIIQVQHIRDEIARFDWNRLVNKRKNNSTNDGHQVDEADEQERVRNIESIIFIGERDDKLSAMKKRFVHRMGDYVQSIENHMNDGDI